MELVGHTVERRHRDRTPRAPPSNALPRGPRESSQREGAEQSVTDEVTGVIGQAARQVRDVVHARGDEDPRHLGNGRSPTPKPGNQKNRYISQPTAYAPRTSAAKIRPPRRTCSRVSSRSSVPNTVETHAANRTITPR